MPMTFPEVDSKLGSRREMEKTVDFINLLRNQPALFELHSGCDQVVRRVRVAGQIEKVVLAIYRVADEKRVPTIAERAIDGAVTRTDKVGIPLIGGKFFRALNE